MSLRLSARLAASAVAAAFVCTVSPAATPDVPAGRPSGRTQAIAVLAAGSGAHATCLAPIAAGVRSEPSRFPVAARRALAALYTDPVLPSERRVQEADGTVVRWSADRWSVDRLDGADGNGRPDAVEAALAGVRAARRLLAHHDFPSPGPVEIALARLGSGVEGLVLPRAGREGRTVLLLEGQPRGGLSGVRLAAAHQYAHAVAAAMGPGLPPSWSEALATWVGLVSDPSDARALASIARRIDRLPEGLGADDHDLASGDAAWLAFLDASYGPTALRLLFDELGRPGTPVAAFDRALRRAVGISFAEAFREFHLWTVLVGARADAHHFPFASRLPSPAFVSSADGLPAVSVLGDPAVAPAGGTSVRLVPGEARGGMTVRLEGEVNARWEADLILIREGRPPHRLAVPIRPDGKGEVTVPLDDLTEALLLVRNVDGEEREARRFTWSAFRHAAYPFEMGAAAAAPAGPGQGVVVSWETLSESGALGFNVLRTREDGGITIRVNPVWMPAVGDRTSAALYQFVDAGAEPGVSYVYRIEGITPEGLTSLSEPVVAAGR